MEGQVSFIVCGGLRAGVIQWSAKYAFSMKADQIPKIGLLLVFFLLKSLLFGISHKIMMKRFLKPEFINVYLH